MAEWKSALAFEEQNFLYIQEINSNGSGFSTRLEGVSPSLTVQELKKLIAVKLDNVSSWNHLRVLYGGTELSELNATLESFGVFDCETLHFLRSVKPVVPKKPKPVEIPPPPYAKKVISNVMFRDLKGKTMNVRQVPTHFTIGQLRERLGKEKTVEGNVEVYQFIWGGKELEDGRTLEDYKMDQNLEICTIHMVVRMRGGLNKEFPA
ncbi:hypothetical protein BGZ60DRAFT_538635 [Tricladium varicosporioides]|nr:hypothetical protein BGZ60DRAFT_538635 [Hymenoscyphus varicosporioides]